MTRPATLLFLVLAGCGDASNAAPMPASASSAVSPSSSQPAVSAKAESSANAPSVSVSASSSAAPPDAALPTFTGLYDLVAGSKTGSPPVANWGRMVFLQRGAEVYAEYPGNGEIRCRADGERLDCDWREKERASGKAVLTREADGALAGTWGTGASATDAGKWKFALLEAADTSSTTPIEGVWDSSWGDFDFSGSGETLVGKSSTGDLRCEEVGPAIDCTWHLSAPIPSPHFRDVNGDNPRTVRERFVRTKRGTLEGTWGVNGCASGGGRWWMAKRPKQPR